jgi:hypothetical protein
MKGGAYKKPEEEEEIEPEAVTKKKGKERRTRAGRKEMKGIYNTI